VEGVSLAPVFSFGRQVRCAGRIVDHGMTAGGALVSDHGRSSRHRCVMPVVRPSEVPLRFTLRTLLIAVAVIAVVVAVAELVTRDYRERRRIESDLHSMGAYYVGFDEHGHLAWVSFVVPVASPRIAEYRSIEHVDLAGAHVTDESIRHLAGLDHIGTIHLTHCDVNDNQLQLLAAISSLTILRLNGARVTDDAIPAIASIHGLKAVDLSGTLVSKDGVTDLQRRCPDLVIRYDPH
jgi:hypothetical protein